jgi:hypothetical protein
MRNRIITAVVVGLGHLVVVMLIWVSRPPTERKNSVLDFATVVFFSTGAIERRSDERSGRPTVERLHLKPLKVDLSELLLATTPNVATLSPYPKSSAPSAVGRHDEAADVASDVIERARVEAGRAMNRPPRSPSYSPLHEKPHALEWISQHSHEVIDEHGVPQWVLVQPCEAQFLVQKPDCTVERVLPHGILFEYMSEQHDATLQYGGPNAIP